MNFTELLIRAKGNDDSAFSEIVTMYKPLLIKKSIVNGVLDEDLYQELWLILVNCIRKFEI